MSQPTPEQPPPAYLVHRGLLITVVVVAGVLATAYLLAPAVLTVVQWVREAWANV